VCRDVWLIKNYYRCGDVFADGKYGFLLWTCPWRTEQGQVQLTTVNHPRVSLVPQNPKSAAAIPTPGQGELSPKQLPCFAEILLSVFSHFLSPLPMNPTKGLSSATNTNNVSEVCATQGLGHGDEKKPRVPRPVPKMDSGETHCQGCDSSVRSSSQELQSE
jgi:hypothetical protein